MDFLPIFLNIKNRNCLVVGGGEVAVRKITLLLQAGAQVSVISPELDASLSEYVALGKIKHSAEHFQPSHLHNAVLVIAATNNRVTNQLVSETARQHLIPVNVVDNPDLCTFIMPSIIDRSPLMIAISSGGQSPVLARLLRAQLETIIPAAYARSQLSRENFANKLKSTSHIRKKDVFSGKRLCKEPSPTWYWPAGIKLP
jgi:uroporphyrin-III C-methyltransferase/precorrin-2 dehydrogenase/sirohydrochlorin ferrochelatase